MRALPKDWQVYQSRSRAMAVSPKARFQAAVRRYARSTNVHRLYGRFKVPILIALAAGTILGGIAVMSPWPVTTTLRHIAAAPNCTAARAVGLAPAYRGQPGYWTKHDRDKDGWACEPWPRSSAKSWRRRYNRQLRR